MNVFMTSGKQSFIKGAMILTAAAVAVKFIGMLYKIPLNNLLGAAGMGYFSSAYSIFNPIYALSVSGLPVAVSKMVSEQGARGRFRDVRKIHLVSMVFFLVFGLLGSLILFFGARFFSGLIGNPGAALSIAAIAPSVLFCCVMSSWRGYYQGLGDMAPTAVSQVMESAVKLACGIAFAYYMIQRGQNEYAESGTVFGSIAAAPGDVMPLLLPWASAGAVLGVTASTAAGALFLFLRGLKKGGGFSRDELARSPRPSSFASIAGGLFKIALPVCLSSALAHLSALIDAGTIINRLEYAISKDPSAVLGMYADAVWGVQGGLANYLYGVFNYTTSLFHLPAAITVALGVSALPSLSAGWALGERSRAAEQISSVIKLSALIAIPAGLGLTALSEPILTLLLPMQLGDVAVAAPLLRVMGLAAVFSAIATPMTSIFQAIGRADIPLKLMIAGAAVKFSANWALLAVPGLNIGGAPVGTLLCYAFVLICGLAALRRAAGEPAKTAHVLIKPLFCGILCAVAANTSYVYLSRALDSRAAVLLSIGAGGAFYAVFVLFLRIITKNEAMLLPCGKKFAKKLEKLSFLG